MNEHKLGDIISSEALYNYIESIHGFDSESNFVIDRILKYNKFELVELHLNKLDLDSFSPALTNDCKDLYLKTKTYPPIFYDIDEKIIVDGYHRANALYAAGVQKILAWVGVTK